MLFNSANYAFFLVIVFAAYWFLLKSRLRAQNLWVLLASYFFYGMWDWRFLSLIMISSLVDFAVGLGFAKYQSRQSRLTLLLISVGVNLGLLGLFKYYDFFIESFIALSGSLGIHTNAQSLNLILPVGISFYTFQTLSYSIDVFRNKLEPCRDAIQFFAYVSFFPQLVAGPIERAADLLPQFGRSRKFDETQASAGLKLILWGLFKKVIVADNCAPLVDAIFANQSDVSASTLALGAVLFAFQIYGDFSGYSDIAIGSALLLGFRLTRNFAYPYFSRDIAEFWRRWHISLTTWFRDYVYIPLGGSRGQISTTLRNVSVVFLVSGLWHGANWTFIVWGLVNAFYFYPLLLSSRNRKHLDTVAHDRLLPGLRDTCSMTFTFAIVCIAWIFFRSDSLSSASEYLASLLSPSIASLPRIPGISFGRTGLVMGLVAVQVGCEWAQRRSECPLFLDGIHPFFRWTVYLTTSLAILVLAPEEQTMFIYFQF